MLVLVAGAAGCGGSDTASGGGTIPQGVAGGFIAASVSAAPDFVRLRQAGIRGDLVTVEVALGGPTASSDLYSFAFDLVLGDPSVATYLNGSASFGTALTLGPGQGSSVLATQSGNRVVVGVTKVGGGGNGLPGGEEPILSLTFRVLRVGTTSLAIEGSPSQNQSGAPAALDSFGNEVPSVVFDPALASLAGT